MTCTNYQLQTFAPVDAGIRFKSEPTLQQIESAAYEAALSVYYVPKRIEWMFPGVEAIRSRNRARPLAVARFIVWYYLTYKLSDATRWNSFRIAHEYGVNRTAPSYGNGQVHHAIIGKGCSDIKRVWEVFLKGLQRRGIVEV